MSSDPDKIWPEVGQKLVHRFYKRPKNAIATVTEVDRKRGIVKVRVKGVTYNSLSTAAQSITKKPTNGWAFWGLKVRRSTRS